MKQKLKELKSILKTQEIDYLIISNNDEWASEYLPDSEKRIEFLTGFDGSNAILIVKKTGKNIFFTDGRYTLQASKQLNKKDFEIFDLSQKSLIKYLVKNIKKGQTVALDGLLHSKRQASSIKGHIEAMKGTFKSLKKNPIDQIWLDQPMKPNSSLFLYPNKYSGEKTSSKIKKLTKNIDKESDAIILNFAPSINWLLNIRASDIKCTPLAVCYCLIYKNGKVDLFIEESRIDKKVEEYFKQNQISVIKPSEIDKHIKTLKQSVKKIQIDKNHLNFSVFNSIKSAKIDIIEKDDPILQLKAVKNKTEIKENIKAHEIDGLALTKFLFWLENNQSTSELEAVDKLLEFRSENKEFIYPSFDTISGFGSNGAIIHYRVNEKTNKKFSKNNLYLVDSGGQYLGGTTDVTRTILIGKKPKSDFVSYFTRVLKGHISIARCTFPKGTKGSSLDILARNYLWNKFKDYAHGTGHGVGQFLGVHESPPGISKFANDKTLEEGMILSNEPGYYENGKVGKEGFGIRIENLMLVEQSENKDFLQFKTLTLAPIDPRLVNLKMMTYPEKKWLKNYHNEIYKKFSKKLNKDEKSWLKDIRDIYGNLIK